MLHREGAVGAPQLAHHVAARIPLEDEPRGEVRVQSSPVEALHSHDCMLQRSVHDKIIVDIVMARRYYRNLMALQITL